MLSSLRFLTLASSILAHTQLFSVNTAASKQDKSCILETDASAGRNSPIKDVTSPDMTCGKGAMPASAQCEVAAGEKMELIYGHDKAQDDIMASSHSGPCNMYMVATDAAGASAPTGTIEI